MLLLFNQTYIPPVIENPPPTAGQVGWTDSNDPEDTVWTQVTETT